MVGKGLGKFVLWPHYFDATLSRAEGRRVSQGMAVKGPDAAWIEAVAKRLGLEPEVEEKARHPSVPYESVGRVLVAKKGSKEAVVALVAEKMKAAQAEREAERSR